MNKRQETLNGKIVKKLIILGHDIHTWWDTAMVSRMRFFGSWRVVSATTLFSKKKYTHYKIRFRHERTTVALKKSKLR